MAFELPTFNITVDIYDGPWLTKALRLSSLANFAWGRRVQQFWLDFGGPPSFPATSQSLLLLPPLTDIRSGIQVHSADVVEIPSGSGRWYQVGSVDDIGKGFGNEHRAAVVIQISHFTNAVDYAGCTWPIPMT